MKENKALPLIAGAVIQLCIGIIYIWSIFQPSVMEYYSWSAADASAVLRRYSFAGCREFRRCPIGLPLRPD